MLLIDCSQHESVLGLVRAADSVRTDVTTRTYASSMHAAREPFWDELRALTAEAGVAPGAIRSVAVAVGPGGFTGLRVSVAFAQALAMANQIPIVAVPSAAIFSVSDRARGGRGPWLVALAAKERTAWVALVAHPDKLGSDVVADEGSVVDPDAFSALIAEVARLGGVLLADDHLAPELAACAQKAEISTRALEVEPRAFAALASEILAARGGIAPALLRPIYAREPEAVTKWRQRKTAR